MNYNEEAIVRLQKPCPLCSSVHTKPVLSERNNFPEDVHPEVKIFNNSWINLLECQICNFAFTQEIPVSPTFFINRYNNEWYNPENESESLRKSEILEDIFSKLNQLGHSSGNLLDVGSFAGKLLRKASSSGFVASGVEINPKLALYTKEKLGFEMICSEFQKLDLEENKYQVITIIDVLEHLVDPRDVLQKLTKGLAPEGILVIKVPNYPMQKIKQRIANITGLSSEGIFANFGHINHFSIKAMQGVLQNSGLELAHITVAPSEKWDETNFPNKIKNIIRDIYYLLSKFVYIKLGLNICYYAKKKVPGIVS